MTCYDVTKSEQTLRVVFFSFFQTLEWQIQTIFVGVFLFNAKSVNKFPVYLAQKFHCQLVLNSPFRHIQISAYPDPAVNSSLQSQTVFERNVQAAPAGHERPATLLAPRSVPECDALTQLPTLHAAAHTLLTAGRHIQTTNIV